MITIAVARELAGLIRDIVRREMGAISEEAAWDAIRTANKRRDSLA